MTFGYKAAIFDMDGTLLDSMRYWRLGVLEYLLVHGLPVQDRIMPKLFYQSGRITLAEALKELGVECDINKIALEMAARMRTHYLNDVQPKPGAIEYLKKLNSEGVRCCVATATPKKFAAEALERHGINQLIEFIYDESDAGTSKNHVEFFQDVCKRLDVPMHEAVMFEDAVYAMRTVKKTPMGLIAIRDITARDDYEEILSLADRYISEFFELM